MNLVGSCYRFLYLKTMGVGAEAIYQGERSVRQRAGALAIGLALCAASALHAQWQPPFSARVVGVIDGDTVEVLRGQETIRVRLEGIDAPEPGEPYSTKAKERTGALVFGKQVTIVPKERDRYGRLVARVLVGETDASVDLVERGLAWHYAVYFDDPVLAAGERTAKSERLGLWSLPNPAPPWEFKRVAAASSGSVVYRGNVSSRVFHSPSCRYYSCKNCTREFNSREEAIAAGYRPGGHCKP